MKKMVNVKCGRRAENPSGPEKYASVFIVREQVDEFFPLYCKDQRREIMHWKSEVMAESVRGVVFCRQVRKQSWVIEESNVKPTRRDTHVRLFHRFTSVECIPFCCLARLLLLLLMALISMVTRLAMSSLTDISTVPLPTTQKNPCPKSRPLVDRRHHKLE